MFFSISLFVEMFFFFCSFCARMCFNCVYLCGMIDLAYIFLALLLVSDGTILDLQPQQQQNEPNQSSTKQMRCELHSPFLKNYLNEMIAYLSVGSNHACRIVILCLLFLVFKF